VSSCGVESFYSINPLHAECVYEMIGEKDLPPVLASEAGKLGGRRPAGVAEVMSTDSGVPPQVPEVIQEFLVLGDYIHGCGVACACGVEVGRGVAPAAAVAAVEAAIVAAVLEGTGAEPGGLAAVAVGHRRRAFPRQDM
jgi:hypothetical protein